MPGRSITLIAVLALAAGAAGGAADEPARALEVRRVQVEERRQSAKWRHAICSRHYDIFSNGDAAEVRRVAGLMDAMLLEYRRIFAHTAPLPGALTIELYADRREFMAREDKPETVDGFYDGVRIVAFHGGRTTEALMATLFHEGAHQFQHLLAPDMLQRYDGLVWLMEGLAVYFESSRFVAAGEGWRLVTGRPPADRLRGLKTRLRARAHTPLPELIRTPQCRFDAEHYAQAWSLVHFFVHADGGKHRKHFLEYFRRVTEGREDSVQAFEAVFDRPMPQIEAAWRAYVLGL